MNDEESNGKWIARHEFDRCQYTNIEDPDSRIFRNTLLLDFLKDVKIASLDKEYNKRVENSINIAYQLHSKINKKKVRTIDVPEAPKWILMFNCFTPSIIYREFCKLSLHYQNGVLIVYDSFDDGEVIFSVDLVELPTHRYKEQREKFKRAIKKSELIYLFKIESMVTPMLKFESHNKNKLRFSNMPKLYYERDIVDKIANKLSQLGHLVRVV